MESFQIFLPYRIKSFLVESKLALARINQFSFSSDLTLPFTMADSTSSTAFFFLLICSLFLKNFYFVLSSSFSFLRFSISLRIFFVYTDVVSFCSITLLLLSIKILLHISLIIPCKRKFCNHFLPFRSYFIKNPFFLPILLLAMSP